MTPRSRQHERLRSLGLDPADGPRPLHESPAARRLRSRIPRPPLADSPVPAAPYAVAEDGTEYRPQVARNMASPAHRRSSVPTPRHHAASGPGGEAPEEADAPQGTAEAHGTTAASAKGSSDRDDPAVPVAGANTAGAAPVPAPAPVSGSEESTPLTEFLEESDTERLPPPARAVSTRSPARPSSASEFLAGRSNLPAGRNPNPAPGPTPMPGTRADDAHAHRPHASTPYTAPPRGQPATGTHEPAPDGDGRPEHPGHVDGPSSAHVTGGSARRPAHGIGQAAAPISDPDGPDDPIEDHDTTRLRPARVPAPRPPDHAPSNGQGRDRRNTTPRSRAQGSTGAPAPSAARGTRSEPVSESGPGLALDLSAGPRLWNEPPISAQVLRHHRDLTPDTLPSGVPGTVPFGSPGSVMPGSHNTAPFGPNGPSGVDRASKSAGDFDPYRAHGTFGVSGMSVAPDAIGASGPTDLPTLGTGYGTPPSTRSAQDEVVSSPDDIDGPDDLLEGGGTVRLRPRNGSGFALPSPEGEEASVPGKPPVGTGSGRPSGPASGGTSSYGTASSAFRTANRPAATFDDMFPGRRFPHSADQGSPDASGRAGTPNSSRPSAPSNRESTVRIPAADVGRGPAGTPPTPLRSQDRHDPHDRHYRQGRPDRPDHQHPPDSPDRQPTTPRTSTTRRWVGHRPLNEQPREYRRPSWPSDPRPGPPSHDRPSEHHPSDDPPPDGPWNPSYDAWPERDPDDSVTVPDTPANHGAPGIHIPAPPDSPWLDPDEEELLKERRPPSGYVEFDPRDPADAPVNRLARMWGPNATLSKRAVIALFVLGAAAVVAALLFLRQEPEETDVPEMVPQSAPDGENGNGAEGSEGDGDTADGSADAPDDGTDDGSGEDVVVHIGGDVEDPGLYTLPSGSRVLDAVEEAGGALPDADLDMVNLARPVVDGERILLGAEGDPEAAEPAEGGEAQRVSLNQADQSALEALPGIGEAKAGAILEHRESLGGSFSGVEDLLDVSGIGQSTFDNLEDHVTL